MGTNVISQSSTNQIHPTEIPRTSNLHVCKFTRPSSSSACKGLVPRLCVSMHLAWFCYFLLKLLFAGHQWSSQSDHRTNTDFSSFELPTCGWLQKGGATPICTWSPAKSGSWDMLHVGLEHVGSLHVILHIL